MPQPLDQPVADLRSFDQPGQIGRVQARHDALEQPLFRAPHARRPQRHRQRLAGVDRVAHPLQRADVFAQAPVHQHGGLALGFQPVEHADHPRHLAAEYRLAEFEHIEARHVQHRRLDLLVAQHAGRVQQRELLQFLMRGKQIAFDPVGKKAQGALACFAVFDPLALRRQPLGDPLRQLVALDRLDPHGHAGRVQSEEPGAGLLRLVELGQGHDGHHVLGQPLAIALQGLRTVLAGLAAGDADVDQLAVGKQAQRLRRAQHRRPVEMRAGDDEDFAFAVTLGARRRANRVGGLLLQQRFVAVDRVDRAQALGELGGEGVGAELHVSLGA